MKTNRILTALAVVFLLGSSAVSSAQDGKSLFDTNCSACHHPTKPSVGPPLQNVRAKWADNAGTEDLIYVWVNNWKEATEMDNYALEVSKLKPSEMNTFNLSKEEMDAIFDYADNPPVVKPTDPTGDMAVVEVLPDYERNMNIMIVLFLVGIVLVLYIMTMVHTIRMITGSKYFRERKKEGNQSVKTLLVLIGLSLIPATSMAAGVEPNETFFKFTETDIWYVLVIDLILLGCAMYIRYVFRQIVSMRTEPVQLRFFKKRSKKAFFKVFNNAVPLEEERDILMDHDYDGIQELDNRLPPWWLYMFYASIIFAVVYLFHFHVFKTGDLQIAAYEKDVKEAEAQVAEYLEKMALNVDENSVVILNDGAALAEGQALFEKNCVICHGQRGEGGNGANLSDHYWIYGNRINDIFRTIKYGGANGMKSWEGDFNPVQIQALASYVALTFNDVVTPENGGKDAEGDYYEQRIDGLGEGGVVSDSTATTEVVTDSTTITPVDTSNVSDMN